jgi:hypothetical protein
MKIKWESYYIPSLQFKVSCENYEMIPDVVTQIILLCPSTRILLIYGYEIMVIIIF